MKDPIEEHVVYFILDTHFDGDLWSLSRKAYVWIVRSQHNEQAVQTVWDREKSDYSPLQGVTLINGREERIETFYQDLGTINLHHNEYSSPRPWDKIYVCGITIENVSKARIGEILGFDSFTLHHQSEGFVIVRITS